MPEMDMTSFNYTVSLPVCPNTGYRCLSGRLVNKQLSRLSEQGGTGNSGRDPVGGGGGFMGP